MVNLEAARRQALGTHFTEAENESELVARLKNRRLHMAPHKEWSLPEVPTWRENPFDDNNWEFQYHMLRWLDPLRRAGAAGDRDAALLWEKYARSWIEANQPGSDPYKWAWIDMSDGIRAMELCHGLTVVGEQPWLINSLRDHVGWLLEPSHLKRGNHGFHQHVGLFVLGVVLEDQKVTDVAMQRLTDQFEAAYDEQGANEEGSISYHLQNYVWWNDAFKRLDLEGVARPVQAPRLELAPTLLAHATTPLGRFARIGDTDGGNARKVNHPHTQFTVSRGKKGRKPESTTAIYDAGYAFMRSGWGENRPYEDETFVTATWGRQDKVHGHRDGGSITYATDGVQWIDDTGKFYYGKHPMRTYVVNRAGHNSIVIPGKQYQKKTQVYAEQKKETDDYVEITLHDHGYNDILISRRVIYLKKRRILVIVDSVNAEVAVSVEQRWHAGKNISMVEMAGSVRLFSGLKTLDISSIGPQPEISITKGNENPFLGWMSNGWRRRVASEVLSLKQAGERIQFITTVGRDILANDLLLQSQTPTIDLNEPLEEWMPREVLVAPRKEPTVWTAVGSDLTGEAWLETGRAVTVNASGPAEFYAFSIITPNRPPTKPIYSRRNLAAFMVHDPNKSRIKIYNRNRSGPVKSCIVDIKT